MTDTKDLDLKSLADLQSKTFAKLEKKLIEKRIFGVWKLNLKDKTLTHIHESYEIELGRIKTVAQQHEWIFHLKSKNWIDAQALYDFIDVIQSIQAFHLDKIHLQNF